MQIVFNGADGTDVTVDHVEVLGSSVFEGGTILFMKNDTKVKIKETPRQVAEMVNECFGIKKTIKFRPTHVQYCDNYRNALENGGW